MGSRWDISPQCRALRHTACPETAETCLCEHHDDPEFAGAVEAARELEANAAVENAPPPVAVADSVARVVAPLRAVPDEDPMADLTCCGRVFGSVHAVTIHKARALAHQADTPAKIPEEPVVNQIEPEPDPLPVAHEEPVDVDGVTVNGVGQLFLDVADARAFIEARSWDEIVVEALDEWAARWAGDTDVMVLVAMRREHRERF